MSLSSIIVVSSRLFSIFPIFYLIPLLGLIYIAQKSSRKNEGILWIAFKLFFGSVIFTLIASIFTIILLANHCAGEGCWEAFLAPILFGETLVVFFILSSILLIIIRRGRRNNPNYTFLKRVPASLVALGFIIFFSISSVATVLDIFDKKSCNLISGNMTYSDDACLAAKSIEEQNPIYCEKAHFSMACFQAYADWPSDKKACDLLENTNREGRGYINDCNKSLARQSEGAVLQQTARKPVPLSFSRVLKNYWNIILYPFRGFLSKI